jgi:LmbE family N-acetylglucosaminyl deacetylase
MAEKVDGPAYQPLKPKVVLCVAAHPDDLEFGSAGSIAKWVSEGAEAYYLILTNGNKGSSDRSLTPDQLKQTRDNEQRKAGKVLGLKDVFFLDYEDGLLMVNPDLKKEIVRVIRRVKPDVVITMDPTMVYSIKRGFVNHTDHRAAGQATIDAVFPLARDHLSFPDLLTNEGLEPHKTATLLLTNFDNQNFFVDISDYLDQKLKALAEHGSQIPDFSAAKERITEWAAIAGGKVGAKYAEGFVRLELPR